MPTARSSGGNVTSVIGPPSVWRRPGVISILPDGKHCMRLQITSVERLGSTQSKERNGSSQDKFHASGILTFLKELQATRILCSAILRKGQHCFPNTLQLFCLTGGRCVNDYVKTVAHGFLSCDSSINTEKRELMKYTMSTVCSSRKYPSI